MKQKLLAVAIASLSGAAFAQSNVTISGVVRLGFEQVSAGGATVAGASATSRNRVTDNGSNIRFSGEEVLGNGLSAWWQMESAMGVSDNAGSAGAASNAAPGVTTLGSRNTAVGLKGGWGNLFMGKWDVHYNSGNGVDTTNGNDAFSSRAQVLNILHGNGAAITAIRAAANANNAVAGAGRNAANAFGGRQNNVISYVSPNFSGFDVRITHSTQAENTAANMSAKDKTWAVNPAYSNGPIHAFYSWMKLSNTGAAVVANVAGESGNNLTGQRLGASYTFPMGFKIGLVWDKNKADVADGSNSFDAVGIAAAGGNVGAHASRERTAWAMPIQYVTGPHRVNFAYAKAGNLKTNIGTVNDSGAKLLVLGYEYSLSKRTSVAALYSAITNGTNAAYDFREASVNIAGTSGTGLAAGADPRTIQLGLRHAF